MMETGNVSKRQRLKGEQQQLKATVRPSMNDGETQHQTEGLILN